MDGDDAVLLPMIRAGMAAWMEDPENRRNLSEHLVTTGLYHQDGGPAPHRIHDTLNACVNELRAATLFLLDARVLTGLARSTPRARPLAVSHLPSPAGMVFFPPRPPRDGGSGQAAGPDLLDLPIRAVSWFTCTGRVQVRYWRARADADARFTAEEPVLWPLGHEKRLFDRAPARLAAHPDIGAVWEWMTGSRARYQPCSAPREHTEFIERQAPGSGIRACFVTWNLQAVPASLTTGQAHAE